MVSSSCHTYVTRRVTDSKNQVINYERVKKNGIMNKTSLCIVCIIWNKEQVGEKSNTVGTECRLSVECSPNIIAWSSVLWWLYCLPFFVLQRLITPLVYSNFSLYFKISSDMYTQRPSLFISAQILHTTYYVSLFKLSAEEVIKIEQRKGRNRRSAERARIKRKSKEDELHQVSNKCCIQQTDWFTKN
jgi:hypothetical protein